MLDWKESFLVFPCLPSSLFVYAAVWFFFASRKDSGLKSVRPRWHVCQLLIRSAVLAFQGVICSKDHSTASAWFWLLHLRLGPSLNKNKIGTFLSSHQRESVLLLFKLLFYAVFLSAILTRCTEEPFSKQFQPWHLLVRCLPPPGTRICSPHKLDPIRWHQTMAYSSISPAQRQGSPTIRKCFLFHYGASDPFKGVYPPPMCQPPVSERGLSWGSDRRRG